MKASHTAFGRYLESRFDSDPNGLGRSRDAETFEYQHPVHLDGFLGNPEAICDLLVELAPGDELEDLAAVAGKALDEFRGPRPAIGE